MHRVAVAATAGVAGLDLAIPGQVFGTAHSQDKPAGALFGASLYEVIVCGPPGGVTVTGVGGFELFRLTTEHDLSELVTADTVIVPCAPGPAADRTYPTELLDALRAAHGRGVRVASICTGAFILAAAGLLDGLRATTHWTAAAELAAAYPSIEVDPDVLFVDNGAVLTSAGAATGLDLCVHMVRRDFGAAVAADTARHLVIAPQRAGGQAQFIVHPEPGEDTGSLEPTMRWARDRLAEPLTLADLACRAAMSPRTLNRRFREQTGTTPLQWLLTQRVRRAQELLETTTLSVEEIARHCGFGTSVLLRQHFGRQVRTSPMAYRRTFQPQ